MTRHARTLMCSSALLVVLAVAASGCAVRGRATVTPMRAVILAPQPAISGTVVVAQPAAPAVAVATYAQPDAGIVLGQGQVVRGVAVAAAPPVAPADAVVAAPGTRAGYVWVRGHYRWTGAGWVWTHGGWLRERAGYVWVQPSYDATHATWFQGFWAPAGHRRVIAPAAAPAPRAELRASVRVRAAASITIR